MGLGQLLEPEAVFENLRVTSKKNLLQALSERAAELTGLPSVEVFHSVLERERLGATGIGGGVAIPHARLPDASKVSVLFARLEKPVAFDAPDDVPVDLVFLLLAPEQASAEHLKALAKISRLMRDKDIRDKLRGAEGREALFISLTGHSARAA